MATKKLCFLCFETLDNRLCKTSKNGVAQSFINNENTSESYPMFVTWTNNGNLRGCKGSFKSLPLIDGLKEMAIDAAFNDRRFPHLESSELPTLTCSISLLHSFEKATTPLDWEIGIHGIRLYLHGRSSTYLPHVALEHHWNKMEALAHLAKKGGFSGKYDENAFNHSKVEKYQASRESATWNEYQEYIKNLK